MIKQLTVKLDNRPGMLKDFVGLLAEHGIDIKALEITERADGKRGEIHLIVNNRDKAMKAIDQAGYSSRVENVLVVEMDDRVGRLASVLDILASKEIDIRYLYAFVSRIRGKSLAVFGVEDISKAQCVLEEARVPLLSQASIEESGDSNPPDTPSLEDHFGIDFIW
ncbi:MAG: ACT domain-containing protein [Proteobacteria bacterium]|nr:ACT domain-containing protein [Pseudomonadota bacterium]